jgi:hypothetical protein
LFPCAVGRTLPECGSVDDTRGDFGILLSLPFLSLPRRGTHFGLARCVCYRYVQRDVARLPSSENFPPRVPFFVLAIRSCALLIPKASAGLRPCHYELRVIVFVLVIMSCASLLPRRWGNLSVIVPTTMGGITKRVNDAPATGCSATALQLSWLLRCQSHQGGMMESTCTSSSYLFQAASVSAGWFLLITATGTFLKSLYIRRPRL